MPWYVMVPVIVFATGFFCLVIYMVATQNKRKEAGVVLGTKYKKIRIDPLYAVRTDGIVAGIKESWTSHSRYCYTQEYKVIINVKGLEKPLTAIVKVTTAEVPTFVEKISPYKGGETVNVAYHKRRLKRCMIEEDKKY